MAGVRVPRSARRLELIKVDFDALRGRAAPEIDGRSAEFCLQTLV
jgi:hypothetical protein